MSRKLSLIIVALLATIPSFNPSVAQDTSTAIAENRALQAENKLLKQQLAELHRMVAEINQQLMTNNRPATPKFPENQNQPNAGLQSAKTVPTSDPGNAKQSQGASDAQGIDAAVPKKVLGLKPFDYSRYSNLNSSEEVQSALDKISERKSRIAEQQKEVTSECDKLKKSLPEANAHLKQHHDKAESLEHGRDRITQQLKKVSTILKPNTDKANVEFNGKPVSVKLLNALSQTAVAKIQDINRDITTCERITKIWQDAHDEITAGLATCEQELISLRAEQHENERTHRYLSNVAEARRLIDR